MRVILLLLLSVLATGCSKEAPQPETDAMAFERGGRSGKVSFSAPPMTSTVSDTDSDIGATLQKVIRNGQLSVEVEDLDSTEAAARAAVRERGGRIESATRFKDERVHLRIRIPAAGLDPTIDFASGLGRVISRTVSENDVTTRYIDTAARLKTRVTLRDRLQKLLETAESVEDILNIERELARVQGEIDSMQGQLNYFDRQVAESTLDLTLQISAVTEPEQRPGPLGYVFVGIWKAVKWLFVWEN